MNEHDWRPITKAHELAALCAAPGHAEDCLEGYRDGRADEPPPGPNRSPSYRHGWFNGDNDRTGRYSPEAIALIRDCRRVWGDDITKWGSPIPEDAVHD